jgi:hypothetical protein
MIIDVNRQRLGMGSRDVAAAGTDISPFVWREFIALHFAILLAVKMY